METWALFPAAFWWLFLLLAIIGLCANPNDEPLPPEWDGGLRLVLIVGGTIAVVAVFA